MDINEYLLELVQKTSRELLKIYHKNPDRVTLLKFPKYRNGEIRISEQELRFTLTNIHERLSHLKLNYSVETPTQENYSFSKNGNKRSASSDLSFYCNKEKVLNIEFKAHNVKQESINKDIEKLVSENCNGAWIHIFKKEKSDTVKILFNKLEKAFDEYSKSNKPISFFILILETKTLLSRRGNEIDYSNNIFNINYELWNKLKGKSGNYQFYNGTNHTNKKHSKVDWQIDIFDI